MAKPERPPKETVGGRPPGDEPEDFHAEDVIDRPFDRGLALRLLGYVAPYKRKILLSVAIMLAGTILSLVGPILVKEAIDGPLSMSPDPAGETLLGRVAERVGLTGDPAGAPGAGDRRAWLLAIAGLCAFLLLGQFLFRYAETVVMNSTGQTVMRDLRMQLFRHLERQSLPYFQSQPVGRLVTRVTSDVEALNELFTSGFVTLAGDLLSIAGIVTMLFWYNPVLAAVALSVTPFLLGITLLFRHMARKHYREVRRRLAHLNAFTQESIVGMDIVQIHRQEERQAARYGDISGGLREAHLKSVFWYAVFFPVVELLSTVSLALVLVRGGVMIEMGGSTFGEFFLFWTYLTRFFTPMRDLAEKYNLLQAAMASAERVFSILDADSALPEATDPQEGTRLRGTIRFDNVCFSYDQKTPVLKHVSFEARRGETVALVGATGAGKSTVVNLLLRFYDPVTGRVEIDGLDVREVALAQHRSRFGLVLQDVAVFSRSIEENIAFDRGLDRERIVWAAEQVHARAFVERQGAGFDEVMKERGRTLSSGERQLLAFARALAGDPEILVLDEATSNIDSDTEALIQDALARLVEGRTSFIIAHRLSTIRNADRILVFHHGELREQGNHADLLARGGIYARLYRLQFGAERPGREGAA
ncbi:MAG: ABC transporter ATP-binding protein [Planctomycetota bacterium]